MRANVCNKLATNWFYKCTALAAHVRRQHSVVMFQIFNAHCHWWPSLHHFTPTCIKMFEGRSADHLVVPCVPQMACACFKQELSYRKEIARHLRTQYVEGIYRSNYPWPWNLGQGSLKVTGNGTIGQIIHHLLLVELFDGEYYRDLEMWVRGHSITENGTIWKLGYGFLFASHGNYGRIFSHFADIQHQRMAWPWNMGLGSFRVI